MNPQSAIRNPQCTALVYHELYKAHHTGPDHPECPERLDAVLQGLTQAGLDERLVRLTPRPATHAEIAACHTPEYLALAQEEIAAGCPQLSTGDTVVSAKSWEAALLAAGGVLTAVDAVIEGKVKNAFCAVRPPGHHAESARGMGFCVLNNVAIGTRYAQRKHGVGKVVIIDWDVHHGNGTQDIFYDDGTVFYFSTHQFPWYPGTGYTEEKGAGQGQGRTMNCPFRAGAGGKEILGAFTNRFLPAVSEFKPELVMISAGFDGHEEDPLGGLRLTDEDFAELTRLSVQLARDAAGGRLVSVLEGGYNLETLGKTVATHVKVLADA
ncbi:MAG: histone deacetylase [Planctomycetota bacterium]|nr:histone deacetylase [Planctomycetota bacterium]